MAQDFMKPSNNPSLSPVPAWLEGHPANPVPPPVETRLQDLPFDELHWEDFEKLCYRLARLEADVEHCQLYGNRGQEQEGIDIYARQKESGTYTLYQCKRVREFGPAAIRQAVTDFLDGKWAAKASIFVLCTTSKAVKTQYADALETEAKRLREKGISLLPWDAGEIQTRLKDLPELVDDFFGRGWTRAFCGKDVADRLTHRLDANDVLAFRRRLGTLYRYVFDHHDPGIPVPPKPGAPILPLSERYVLPDVYSEELVSSSPAEATAEVGLDFDDYALTGPGLGSAAHVAARRSARPQQKWYRRREPVDIWLAKSRHSVVLGGPGSGKSTLLRYLVLDLLSESPTLERTSTLFARSLPVWIPFAFWTKLVTTRPGGECSLFDCIREWLERWGNSDLWPLVQNAIEDERSLLIVDGLDEWTREDAGRIASHMLQVFVETRNVAAVVASRPYGIQRVPLPGSRWQLGELAELSPNQRKELSLKWFAINASRGSRSQPERAEIEQAIKHTTEQFLRELSDSPDLSELAGVPILLLLLLYLRFQHVALPTKRFEAYRQIVDHFLREHPAGRRAAAQLVESDVELTHSEIQQALARVAAAVQESHPDGIIPESEVERFVHEFLTDSSDLGLGLSTTDARPIARQFVSLAEGYVGLMVRQGVHELGFLHRSIREFLAAVHISRLGIETQADFVERNCADSRWHEVILALLWLTQRPQDLGTLVDRIERSRVKRANERTAEELLAEVAFGDFNCSVNLARRLASDAFGKIEHDSSIQYRQRLLKNALAGLQSTKTREMVRSRVRRWVYERTGWRPSWYQAMRSWPCTSETVDTLLATMNDEDAGVQRAAADSLAAVGRGNEDVGNKLADIAISALDPLKRAAALEALSNGWPEHAKLESAIAWALKTPAPDLRLAAIAARVRRRAQNDSDLEELLSMASDRGFNVNYGWSNEVTATLAAGWPASGRLKQACLEGAQKYFIHGTGVDKDVAWRVLLLAFPQDSDVAKLCVAEIRSQQYPFLGLDFEAWQILAKNFRDHPEVVAAIDEWAPSQEYHDPEVALAAMTGRTPTLKQKLITSLKTSSIPHWPAGSLLEGWGMGDSDVARELLAVANGPADRASSVAHLVPQILNDPVQSRARLLDHLEDPDSKRRDFVMTGLAQLGQGQDDGEIVSRCMKVLPAVKDFDRFGFETQLILGFAKSAQVRKFAVTALGQREAPIAAIASAYSSDEEMRSMVIECVRPLPQALRAQIVSHLNNSPSDGGFALSILEDYDTESDAELKVLSSIGFHRRLAGSPIDTTEAVQKLSKVICAYGPDHEERRCAAFTGLTILKRLDLMTDSLETIGDPDPVSINIHHRGQVNVSLVRFIAEHWVELRTIFGPKLAPRLAGRFGSIAQFWEGLCIVGFDFPEMHQELFDALQADQELAVQPSALHFLARTQPRSSLLLERCLSALSRSDATWGDVDRLRNATAVFTDNFGGDPDIVKTLLSRIPPDLRRSGLVLALCCGWPDNPVIDELNYQLQHRNRPTVGQSVYLALTYARIPSDRLPKQLEDHLNRIPLRNLYVSRALADAVLWRLKHDPTAARSLLSSLSRDTYPSGKCTIPALLAKTQGVSPELARWSEEEVTYQLQVLESPQLGFDLARGHISSVVLSLFDLQDSTSAREL